jgi:hypothetical protein
MMQCTIVQPVGLVKKKCGIASIDFLEQADSRAISIHKRPSSKYLHLLQNENQGPVKPGFFKS